MARGYPDYEGDKVGVYSIDEWAAREGYDINEYTTVNNIAINGSWDLDYIVPANRELYIVSINIGAFATVDADKDNNQMCHVTLKKILPLPIVVMASRGGNGGAGIVFRKPIRFTAGQTVQLTGHNRANHNQNMSINMQGYEVTL